jgi:hypothetical protein
MEQATDNLELTESQKNTLEHLRKTLLGFLIADVILVLYLTFGMVFPSKTALAISDTEIAAATVPAPSADAANSPAKSSPLNVNRPRKQKHVKVPVVSARREAWSNPAVIKPAAIVPVTPPSEAPPPMPRRTS